MAAAFFTTLEQMIRILLFLSLGFALNRLHILPKGSGTAVSRLLTTVFMPSLLIYSNMSEFNIVNVGEYSQLVLWGGFFIAITILLAIPVSRKLGGDNHLDRNVYLYGLCFPNTGAVGGPLAMAMFGTLGYFKYNLFLLFVTLATYAWGVSLFLDVERKNPVKRFFVNMMNPIFLSMAIGLVLGAIGAKNWVPDLVTSALKDLGSCYIPISLVMTGFAVAEYPLDEVFKRPRSYIFALLRLIVIPVLVLVLAWVLRVPQSIATLLAITYAGPCGMNVVVFPSSYGRDCRTGASIVLLSSLGSILTVPVIYSLMHLLFS